MSKSLRLSETWFNRGLWVLALIFAGFLIGLGGVIVGDLPQVDDQISQEDFVDQARFAPLRAEREAANEKADAARTALDQAQLKLDSANSAYASAREAFQNWVATRTATQRPEQDSELTSRTAELDKLQAAAAQAQIRLDAQRQQLLDAQQARNAASDRIAPLMDAAQGRYEAALRASELRVFGYRLALTLPLLGLAGWLFSKQRKSRWWPFVWGFILFALFAFFVELVPYLPSYGGYVRFIVGIIITVLVGRWAILAANRYMAQQRLAEQQPDTVRRQELSYDTALVRMAKNVCPGCERPVDFKNTEIDFCPHCGIGLFDKCGTCTTRKNAFAPFCHACGTPAEKATA